ncbi:MAG TPA: FtsX-like permease family protein [Candidatus Eisenbacteria bacterium]|uniref:FtsX-like permease family protein n=1 Tax=Eiseniibacteriota bacterium TaxID=2212470 RepID=A0A7V2AW96_UNCEI|nr:FtsX-like permease family protein [Candidatus Eisenbacteria bacterium]
MPAGTPAEPVHERKGQIWNENFRQALEVIRTHRMRSWLLIVGVAIGVTTVLAMVTVMSGLGKRVETDIVSANRPYLFISRFDPMGGDQDRRDLLRRKQLTIGDARFIEDNCVSCDLVDLNIDPGGRMRVLRYEGERTNLIQVVGATHNMGRMYSISIDAGRFFTEFETDRSRRVIVLGYGPAKDLFPNRDPIGKWIKIANHQYEVVGTMAQRKSILGSISDNYAVVPFTTYEKDLGFRFDDYQLAVTAKPEYELDEVVDEVYALMRASRKLGPGEESDFYITTSEGFKEMLSNITKYIGVVLIVISSIGLMVGGIGVMNIMLISVTERTREVGIRMALGARRNDIMQQFLIEAATLTGVGGSIGIFLGLLAARGVAKLISFPYSVPFVWIIIAFVFSASIGLIFGLYPANRAARMDPIKALHYE